MSRSKAEALDIFSRADASTVDFRAAFDYSWMPTSFMLHDEPSCGHRVPPHADLDAYDNGADTRPGSYDTDGRFEASYDGTSYLLSRRRKPSKQP